MKKIKLIVVAVFFLSSISGYGQNKSKGSEAEIKKIIQEQEKAWNDGSLERFMAPYWKNDSLLFIGKKGVTYSWSKTLSNYQKSYSDKDKMGTLHFRLIKFEKINRTAYFVVGRWELIRPKEGDLSGHFTLLWRKIKGEWVIVADHSS